MAGWMHGGLVGTLLGVVLCFVAVGRESSGQISLAHAERYRPKSMSQKLPEPATRQSHAAVRLTDGTVLLTGGFSGIGMDGISRDALLFEPRTNAFRATQSMRHERARHRSVLLTDGRVLIVGGMGNRSLDTNSHYEQVQSEIYDPRSETFTSLDDFLCSWSWPDATPLAGGMALVSSNGYYKLWDPVTGPKDVPPPLAGVSKGDSFDQHVSPLFSLSDGRALIMTRRDGDYQLWTFDPRTVAWQAGPHVALKTDPHGSDSWTRANNGALLFASSEYSGSKVIAINPVDGSTRTLKDGLLPYASLASLEGGQIAILGGKDGNDYVDNVYLGNAENGFSRAWFGLKESRSDYTITPLTDGSALIYGGDTRNLPAGLMWVQFGVIPLGLLIAVALLWTHRQTRGYRARFVIAAVVGCGVGFLALAIVWGAAYGAIGRLSIEQRQQLQPRV